MTAILFRMPSGIPGDVSRKSQSTVEPVLLNSAAPFPGYGLFGKIVSGKFQPIGAGDVATAVYGMLVRPFPTQSSQDPLGVSTPPTSGQGDCMRRGYMTVKLNAGTAGLDTQVYVRVAAAASGKPIGGIEAAADTTNTIAITGATFMSGADASGNVELCFNI